MTKEILKFTMILSPSKLEEGPTQFSQGAVNRGLKMPFLWRAVEFLTISSMQHFFTGVSNDK